MKKRMFLLGTVKSGSTSLYHYLNDHDDIYMSPIKEPHFFSKDIVFDDFDPVYKKDNTFDFDYYFSKKSLKTVHLAYVNNQEHYDLLFAGAEENQILGESSTSYLRSSEAAFEIHNVDPKAKFVVVLRNPIERIYSHYLMDRRSGTVTSGFIQAVDDDNDAPKKGRGANHLYIELGMYVNQLKRYFDLFPKEQFHVILTDDLKENPNGVIKEICAFLGIKEKMSTNIGKKYNTGGRPRFPGISSFITRSGIKKFVRKYASYGLIQFLNRLLSKKAPKMSADEFDFSKKLYEKEIKNLSKLLGRNLFDWMKR